MILFIMQHNLPPYPPDAAGADLNILAYYPDPVLSATCIDNRRITKLTLEAHQVASGALLAWGAKSTPYLPSHVHHPVTKWVAAAPANCLWTLRHAGQLIQERMAAGYNVCKSVPAQAQLLDSFYELFGADFEEQPKAFQNSAAHGQLGINFKNLLDAHEAYQRYSIERWKNDLKYGFKPRWRNNSVPKFIDSFDVDLYQLLLANRNAPLPAAGTTLVLQKPRPPARYSATFKPLSPIQCAK